MRYTTIIFEVKEMLGVSLREYIYLDAVYHLQVEQGWCYAKNEYFADLLEVSVREVQKIRAKLIDGGFLEVRGKGVNTELKTMKKWNDAYLCNYEQKATIPRTKVHSNYEQKFTSSIDKEIDKEKNKKVGAKAPPTFDPLGAEIIKALESVDPKNKLYYGNRTQRAACDFLIKEYSMENVLKMINFYVLARGKVKYLPSISTPCELRDKWQKLQDLFARKNAENEEAKNGVLW